MIMHSSVRDLTMLIPPPENPVGAGSAESWGSFEAEFGFPFPADFRSLIDVYGAGGFFDEIGIVSPFSPYQSFIAWHESNLESSGADLFPMFRRGSRSGLLQVGADCNGGHVFLLLHQGDASTLVYGNRELDELFLFKPGIADYLFLIAMGRQCPPSYELDSPPRWKRCFVPDRPPRTA